MTSEPVVLIAAGNRLRGDDAAGFEVLERLRGRLPPGVAVRIHEGEPIALLDAWEGARAVVLVDAVRSGAPPGTLHRAQAGAGAAALPAALVRGSSTHALGAGDAIELARALGRLPQRLVVLGVEGQGFELGAGLSAAVAGALDGLAELVLTEVRALSSADRGMHAKVNLAEKLALLEEPFHPGIVGYFNDNKLAVVKVLGEFVWHTHEDTDDLFLVLSGRLVIELRDREVELGPGELFVVPRGLEHRPRADVETHVLLVEPRGTANTGDAGGEMTVPELEI